MRDCLVLGSGRSGTSMVTGALAGAGAFMGAALHAPRAANPKGFFEAPEINGINEVLLASMLAADTDLGEGQRWLGVPRPDAVATADTATGERIAGALGHAPYCYKDPRFSFTLPAWRAIAARSGRPDPALVCVFRHPASTATSMVKEVASAPYLDGVEFDLARAHDLWIATYSAILEQAERTGGDWLFVHYDQMLSGDGVERLARFVGAELDANFPDAALRRDVPDIEVPAAALEIYERLCALAGHREEREGAEPDSAARPQVGAIVVVEPGDEDALAQALEAVANQRGVSTRTLILDRSGALAGRERIGDAPVLASASLALGVDLARAAQVLATDTIAIERPGRPSLPTRFVRAAARIADGAEVVTCDQMLTDEHGQFARRVSAAATGDAPGPDFDAGLVARASWFASLPTVAFAPVLLAHWRTSVHSGRAGHESEPGGTIDAARHDAAWERSRADARLATLFARAESVATPELTVSICSFNRRDVLAECLEAFCRQEIEPGRFEIVLVDDGSSDGTADMLEGLEFPVPCTVVSRENGGLSAARNSGLEVSRGEFVLFVNDDTIAHPRLVAEHIDAHRALRRVGRDRFAVLGTFEQPVEQFPTALAQALGRSNAVFDYASMQTGQAYEPWKFWTCNVSVRLDMVRAVGGFDESFRHYGCEDTDLAFRLAKLGMQVLFHDAARATHRHDMDFEYLSRRARTTARAYVRLVRKHPELLEQWGNHTRTREWFATAFRGRRERLVEVESTIEELGAVDVAALVALGPDYAGVAESTIDTVVAALPEASLTWWFDGYVQGLDEHGLDGFTGLLADGEGPLPIATASERRLFAWPRWNDPASLDALMQRVEPALDGGFASLVLRLDPVVDPLESEAIAALEAAFARHFDPSVDLDVVLDDGLHDAASLGRLGRSVDAFLPLGGEDEGFLAAFATERLASTAAVAAWRRRFEGADAANAARSAVTGPGATTGPDAMNGLAAPLVSVVVPTRDRGAQLSNLVDRLANQNIDPLRFEVIVVDDGSREPVPSDLFARHPHLRAQVLRIDASGPCAARNRGVEIASGATIVFLNDDAVPGVDLLERHLAAQAESTLPRAVVGRFDLAPQHHGDSLATYLDTTTSLFAQPLMQPGVHYHGLSLCTGNVSVPRALLVAAGGFDEGFGHAGGEDSEMGLRLEASCGLRVVFDPTIVCEHDHALDVRSVADRKRAVGWSIHRIQSLHGDRGLAAGLPWPLAPAQWSELESVVAAERAEFERLVGEVEAFCTAERERGAVQPDGARQLADHMARIERHALFAGLLDGERGRLPLSFDAQVPLCSAA